ncbi:MAG: hypothetical protein R2754_07365 [Microthrixaceae bacterium]
MGRTVRCSQKQRRGRLAKAVTFSEAAQQLDALADDGTPTDARIALYVDAGIAAADVICCIALGEHAAGQSHDEAIDLLGRVDKPLTLDLASLLRFKTRTSDGADAATQQQLKTASRAAKRLVGAASRKALRSN